MTAAQLAAWKKNQPTASTLTDANKYASEDRGIWSTGQISSNTVEDLLTNSLLDRVAAARANEYAIAGGGSTQKKNFANPNSGGGGSSPWVPNKPSYGDEHRQPVTSIVPKSKAKTVEEAPTTTYIKSALLEQNYKNTLADIGRQQAQLLAAKEAAEAKIAQQYSTKTTKQEKAILTAQIQKIRNDYERVMTTLKDNAKYASDAAQFYNANTAAAYEAARGQVAVAAAGTDGMTDTAGTQGGVASVAQTQGAADAAAAQNNLNSQGASWQAVGDMLSRSSANALQRGTGEAILSQADANADTRIQWNSDVQARKDADRMAAADRQAQLDAQYQANLMSLLGMRTDASNLYATTEANRQDQATQQEKDLMLEYAKNQTKNGNDANTNALWAKASSIVPENQRYYVIKGGLDENNKIVPDEFVDVWSTVYSLASGMHGGSDEQVQAVWTAVWNDPNQRAALQANGINSPLDILNKFAGK